MAKVRTLKFALALLLSGLIPASVSSEEQAPHGYILAIAQLYSAKYLISPSEEVGGPFEGEIFFGGVYGAKVKIVRVVSGNFDVEPKYMRLISNSSEYFKKSSPKLVFIRKYANFGYRVDDWRDISDSASRNVCILEADVKTLVSDAMFTASDGHGRRCEHSSEYSGG
ncbi:MAG: hypothetical protein ABI240_09910 [Sphingomonas sp.]